MVDCMIYAPIVIPTLNRIEHLQRCISSLQRNPWAEYTPLIISVDYPPDDRYFEGYKKICEYLEPGISGFSSVEIIFQDKNLGAYENAEFLRKYVGQIYDRYIFMEDDIESSPNFIEFIDKGLDIFANDEDIIAICAGSPSSNENEGENVILTHNFAAYGYGTWIEKENAYYEKINRKYFNNIIKRMRSMIILSKYDPSLLFALQSAILRKERLYQLPDGEIPVIDMTIKIYTVLEKKFVVSPCQKKVRNWGLDGSGVNSPKIENLAAINGGNDQRTHFEYEYPIPMHTYQMPSKYTPETICRVIAAIFKLWIWRLRNNKRMR